jgi:predicted esterase
MGKYILISCFTLFISAQAWSQQPSPTRYKDPVFKNVLRTKNVLYDTAAKDRLLKRFHRFDLYEPRGDDHQRRPLIIWLHGGGFKFGQKRSRYLPDWSRLFARRGYVCVSINYRLSAANTLGSYASLVRACARAREDALMAVRYFKTHHTQYRIDTNCIILAGHSAGGMIALQSVYSSPRDLALVTEEEKTDTMDNRHNPEKIAAIINFWGAVFNPQWLRHARVPIVSVHGKKDRIVPYGEKLSMYGSAVIHAKADSLHIPNKLKTYPKQAHELQRHFNPLWAGNAARKRYREAGLFAAGFLYEQLFNRDVP